MATTDPFVDSDYRRPKIGLALGAGVARGWAHIGVLRSLLDQGVDDGQQLYVYPVKNRRADELASIVGQLFYIDVGTSPAYGGGLAPGLDAVTLQTDAADNGAGGAGAGGVVWGGDALGPGAARAGRACRPYRAAQVPRRLRRGRRAGPGPAGPQEGGQGAQGPDRPRPRRSHPQRGRRQALYQHP